MSPQSNDPHILKSPAPGPQSELSPEAAYLAAITSLPRLLSDIGKVLAGIVETLNGLDESMCNIALYFERKGHDENIFKPDDFTESGDEDE